MYRPSLASKVDLRLMVRQAHHEREYKNPFVLSDSLNGILSDSDPSESLSKDDLAKQGTFGARPLNDKKIPENMGIR